MLEVQLLCCSWHVQMPFCTATSITPFWMYPLWTSVAGRQMPCAMTERQSRQSRNFVSDEVIRADAGGQRDGFS